MRLPIASPLVSRDGAANKDARLTNMLKESDGGRELAVVRPGLVLDAVASGMGNGLVAFGNDLIGVYGTTAYLMNPFSVISGVMPTAGSFWAAPAWNGTVYCSVAASTAYAAISTDGKGWRRTSLPALRGWCAIEWNGSVFCAIAGTVATDKCATSPDGITWTEQTMSSTHAWSEIAWDGTAFCATVADSTVAAVSADGITWADVTLPSESHGGICSIDNTLIVSPKRYQASDFVSISADQGATWSQVAISGLNTNNGYRFGVFGSRVFLFPSSYNVQTPTSSAFVSNDFGFTWSAMSIPPVDYVSKGAGNSYRFVTTGSVASSAPPFSVGLTTTNGETWDTFDLPLTSVIGTITDDIWSGAGSDGNGFALVTFSYGGAASIPYLVTIGTVSGTHFDFAQGPL